VTSPKGSASSASSGGCMRSRTAHVRETATARGPRRGKQKLGTPQGSKMAGRDALGGPRERAGKEGTDREARARRNGKGWRQVLRAARGQWGATMRIGCSLDVRGRRGSSRRAALGSGRRRRRCAALQAPLEAGDGFRNRCSPAGLDGCPGRPGAARLTPRESTTLRVGPSARSPALWDARLRAFGTPRRRYPATEERGPTACVDTRHARRRLRPRGQTPRALPGK
jgi:hypothetical protein